MKVTLQSTDQIVNIPQAAMGKCRVWTGHTEKGVEIHAFICRVAVRQDADASELDRDLQEEQHISSPIDFRKI